MSVTVDTVAVAIAVIGTTSVWGFPYWQRAAKMPPDDWRWKHPELDQEPLLHYWRTLLSVKVTLDFWPGMIYFSLGAILLGGASAALWFFMSPATAIAFLVLLGLNGCRVTSWDSSFLFITPHKAKAFAWLLVSLFGLLGMTQLPDLALWINIVLGSAFVFLQWVSIRVFPDLAIFN